MSNLYREEDDNYKDVINALKGLKKVDAPEDFEMNLFREINTHKHHKRTRLWFGIMPRYTLIPASVVFAVVAIAVVILFNQSPQVVPVKTGESPVMQKSPVNQQQAPAVADKNESPLPAKKETRAAEVTKPQEETATAARAKSETQPTAVSVSEEATGQPVVTSDKVTSASRSIDSSVILQKGGKVTKTDSAKGKKKEIK